MRHIEMDNGSNGFSCSEGTKGIEKRQMRLIGITGGVGAGKSEILSYIDRHYKCRIYLADQVAHRVQEPGERCYERITALLGREVLDGQGRIEKGKMAAKIFADPSLLGQVNDIVHPAVREYLQERIEETERDPEVELFFVEAALLIEAGYKGIMDELWYIHASAEIRERRLRESRGYSPERIGQIMKSQLTEQAFREACDFVIDNSGPLEDSFRQIRQRLEGYTWQE